MNFNHAQGMQKTGGTLTGVPLLTVYCSLLILVLGLLSGCCTDPVNQERYFCLGELSDAEEVALGEQYAPGFIADSGGVYPDAELNATLRGIVIDKLARRSHRPDLPWKFHVLNTSDINAFALPGGQVFVTRGLLTRLQTEAQFAHLMGHEIGHVTHRHSVRGQSRSALFSILVGAVAIAEDQVFDPDEPPVISTAAAAVGHLTLLHFSREQELQSDCRGVDYALAGGYDPRQGVKTFEMFLKLKEDSGQGESLIAGLLSSHPLDSQRISQIDQYILENYPDLSPNLVVSTPQWSATIGKLKEEQRVYEENDKAVALIARSRERGDQGLLDEAEALLRQCAGKLPNHASFHVGLGLIDLERDDLGSAESNLNTACDLDPDHFMARLYRGIVHQRTSQVELAVTDLSRAHQLHPAHPLPCYLLGTVFNKIGNPVQAKEWFEKSLERSPRGSEIRTKSRSQLDALSAVNCTPGRPIKLAYQRGCGYYLASTVADANTMAPSSSLAQDIGFSSR